MPLIHTGPPSARKAARAPAVEAGEAARGRAGDAPGTRRGCTGDVPRIRPGCAGDEPKPSRSRAEAEPATVTAGWRQLHRPLRLKIDASTPFN